MCGIVIMQSIAEVRASGSHGRLLPCHTDAPSDLSVVFDSEDPCIIFTFGFISLLVVVVSTPEEVFFTLVNGSCNSGHVCQALQLGKEA